MKHVLSTRRLALREMSPADLDFVAEMLADRQVMRFYPKSYARDEAEAWIDRQLQRYAKHGHGLWLVSDRATGEPIGQVGLTVQTVDERPQIEVGYLIHRPYWRQGFATEAARACRDYAFHTLNQSRLIALVRSINTPSQGVARKLGMTPIGHTLHAELHHLVFAVDRGPLLDAETYEADG